MAYRCVVDTGSPASRAISVSEYCRPCLKIRISAMALLATVRPCSVALPAIKLSSVAPAATGHRPGGPPLALRLQLPRMPYIESLSAVAAVFPEYQEGAVAMFENSQTFVRPATPLSMGPQIGLARVLLDESAPPEPRWVA